MQELDRLLEVADRLLSPTGCPWDLEQTFFTLQPYLLEETHELLEAIDLLDSEKMCEELGDVFYALIFVAKLAEREGRFRLEQALECVREKLVRRHPHVFGDVKVAGTHEVLSNWEKIKKGEKGQAERKRIFDGIPPSLPMLPRAQKMVRKLRKTGAAGEALLETTAPTPDGERELGERLWELVVAAEKQGIDAEGAFRRVLGEKQRAGEGLQQEWHP